MQLEALPSVPVTTGCPEMALLDHPFGDCGQGLRLYN